MNELRIKLNAILNNYGEESQLNKMIEEGLEFNIALNQYRLFKHELNIFGSSRFIFEQVIFNMIDELSDMCVVSMQLSDMDLCETLEEISKTNDIMSFSLEHKQLIKERVLFKVDRTLERIDNHEKYENSFGN